MRNLLCKSEYKAWRSAQRWLSLLIVGLSLAGWGLLAGCDATSTTTGLSSVPTSPAGVGTPTPNVSIGITDPATVATSANSTQAASPSATPIIVPSTNPTTPQTTTANAVTVLPFTPTAIVAPTPTVEGASSFLSPTPVRPTASAISSPALTPQPGLVVGQFEPDDEERLFVTLLNQYRAAKGAAPLTFEPILWRSARWMAQDMATANSINHTDSQGRDIQKRIKAFGFGGGWVGENIAGGFQHAADNLTIWQSDDIHNNNLLGTHYTKVGVGRYYSATAMNHWNWVLDLGQ